MTRPGFLTGPHATRAVPCAHAFVALLATSAALAQTPPSTPELWGPRSCIIVPQGRTVPSLPGGSVVVTAVDARVTIVEQVATTALEVSLHNPSGARQEAELLIPVPDGAVVRGFEFQGSSGGPTAKLLTREEARRLYDAVVARARDPGILEFARYGAVRSSVFPVEAGGKQKIRVTYEHVLERDGDRIDYVLPRTEAIGYGVPWSLEVRLESRTPISTAYSPSHPLDLVRTSPNTLTARLTTGTTRDPGSFFISCLLERGAVAASLIAYPDASVGGGYFLLLAGLPHRPEAAPGSAPLRREVTLVLDRSGSMAGEKFEQARQAALQVLNSLDQGESFNLIVYSDRAELFSPAPVVKSRETIELATSYLQALRTGSGTNIHEALTRALEQKAIEGCLPIVLFLTDGLPTVGVTSEAAIRDLAVSANPHRRRIFSFGVGFDVNTPLLGKLASETRGSATFVLPKENVEVKVAEVFRKLKGPVLASPELLTGGSPLDCAPASPGRAREIYPARLPDLYEGDQLVILGQYVGADPLAFVLKGNYLGAERQISYRFTLEHASLRNTFVPRLWASRKIAYLVDAVRQLGASDPSHAPDPEKDPRFKELVDEIVKLSVEFGVLTEYTAFLAMEGTDLRPREKLVESARDHLLGRAVACRTGAASVNQERNVARQQVQSALNYSNSYVDANLKTVEVTGVQQVNDRAFYRQGGRWVDSRAYRAGAAAQPRRTVVRGTEDYRLVLERLLAEGREGCLSLAGDTLVLVGDEPVLVTSGAAAVESRDRQ